MTTRISTLRASAELDVGPYVAAAEKKVKADEKMVGSGRSVGQGIEATEQKVTQTSASFNRFRASLDSSFKAQEGVRIGTERLNRALEAGRINAAEHAALQERLAQKFKVGESAANENGKSLERLRNKFVPLAAAQQRYMADLNELRQAYAAGAVSATEYGAALTRVKGRFAAQVQGLNGVTAGLRGAQAGSRAAAETMTQAGGKGRKFGATMQQVGYQVGDFAVQVSSGQSALVAFIQQGTQVLGAFGPWGAVIGASAAVVGGLTMALWDSDDAADAAKDGANTYRDALSQLESQQQRNIDLQQQLAGSFRSSLITNLEVQLEAARAEQQRVLARRRNGQADMEEVNAATRPVQELHGALTAARAAQRKETELTLALDQKHLAQQESLVAQREQGIITELEYTAHLRASRKARADGIEIGSAEYNQLVDLYMAQGELSKRTDALRESVTGTTREYQRYQDTTSGVFSDMETQNEVLKLRLQGHTELADLMQQEAQWQGRLGPLYDEHAEALRAVWFENRNLQDAVDARSEAERQVQQESERSARAYEQVWTQAGQNVRSVVTDMFDDALGNSLQSAESYASAMRGIWRRWAAEMATLAIFQPSAFAARWGSPALGAMSPGAATSAGVGGIGIGDIFSGGSMLFGGGGPGFGTQLVQGSVGQFLGLSTPGISAAQAQALGVMPMAGSTTALGGALANGLNAAPWGFVGSMGASLLGFNGTGNAMADMAMGAAGSIGGAALGSMLGSAGGPVGAIAGAFGMQVLGSLFGGKRPPSFAQTRDINHGQESISQYTSAHADAGAADPVFDAVIGRLTGLVGGLGGSIDQLSGLQFHGKQKGDNWQFGYAVEGIGGGGFGSIEEAAEEALFHALKRGSFDFSGLGDQVAANMQTAIGNSMAGTFEDLAADLQFAATDFAMAFDSVGRAEIDGVAQSITNLAGSFQSTQDRAEQLRLNTDGMGESVAGAADRLFDSAVRVANGLGAVNQALTISESHQASVDALASAGLGIGKAGDLFTAQMTALVEGIGYGTEALQTLTAMAKELAGVDDHAASIATMQAAEVRQRLEEDLALRRLAAEVAIGTASEDTYQTQASLLAQRRELADVTDAATRAELERIHALELQAQASENAAASIAQFTSAARSVSQWLDRLMSTDLGGGSTADQLSAARTNFDDQLALAQAGDIEAYNSITQYAETLIAAQRAWSASGTETANTISYIEDSLSALPAVESYQAEQNELLTAIQGINSAAVDVQVTTMDSLTAAVNDNTASSMVLLQEITRTGDRQTTLLETMVNAVYGVVNSVDANRGVVHGVWGAVDANRGAVDVSRRDVVHAINTIPQPRISLGWGENREYYLRAHASGGMARPGFAVVGESTQGAELVDFARPAQVYSNSQLHDALRSGNGEIVGAINAMAALLGMASDREIKALANLENRLRNLEMAARSREARAA